MEYIAEARPHINDTYWINSAIESVEFRLLLSNVLFHIDFGASKNLEPNRKLNCHESRHAVDKVMVELSDHRVIYARVTQDDRTVKEQPHHSYNVTASHCFADTIGKGKKNDALMSCTSLKTVLVDRFEMLLRDLDTLMEVCWLISDNCKAQYKCWRSLYLEGRLSYELVVAFAIIYMRLLLAGNVSQAVKDQLATNEVRTPLAIKIDSDVQYFDIGVKAIVDEPIDVLLIPNLLARCMANGGLDLLSYALRSRNRVLCRLRIDDVDVRHPRGFDHIPRDLISLNFSHCVVGKILPFNWEGQFGFDVRHQFTQVYQGKGIHDNESGISTRSTQKLETSGLRCADAEAVFVNLSEGVMGAKEGVKQVFDLEALRRERSDKLVSRVRPNTVSERKVFLASEKMSDAVRLYDEGYRNSIHIDRKTPYAVFKSVIGSAKFKEIFFPRELSGTGEFWASSLMCGCEGCMLAFDSPNCKYKKYRSVKKYALKEAATSTDSDEETRLLAALDLSKITKPQLKEQLKSWNVPFRSTALKGELVKLLLSAISGDTTGSADVHMEELVDGAHDDAADEGKEDDEDGCVEEEEDDYDDGDDLRNTENSRDLRCPDLNCIGLENFGNVCWMNAVTQLLSASAYLLSNEVSTENGIASGLLEVLWQLNTAEPLVCISLRKLKQVLDYNSSNKFKTGKTLMRARCIVRHAALTVCCRSRA